VINVFVDALALAEMSFEGVEPAATHRPMVDRSPEASSGGNGQGAETAGH